VLYVHAPVISNKKKGILGIQAVEMCLAQGFFGACGALFSGPRF
jgi:hypothetical protein